MTASLQRFGLARDQMRAALASGSGVSPADLDALEHLEAAGPLTQRQLGERLSLTSGAITMLVDRLERAGWVRRRPHPSDRRSVLVELSAQAAERTRPAWLRSTPGSGRWPRPFPPRTGRPSPASCKLPPRSPAMRRPNSAANPGR